MIDPKSWTDSCQPTKFHRYKFVIQSNLISRSNLEYIRIYCMFISYILMPNHILVKKRWLDLRVNLYCLDKEGSEYSP